MARAPWGSAIPQDAWVMMHWVTLLRLQQKTWGLGLCSMGASLPPHHGPAFTVPYSTQKNLWPICSWGHRAQPASPHLPRRNKRLFFSSLWRLSALKRGSISIDHRYFFQVPPAPVIMYLLSFPGLLSTAGSSPELGSLKPVLIDNPK